jgi:hypothetical protein
VFKTQIMLRSFLLMMLMIGGLSVYGQQADLAKKSCNISQCQARKVSTTSAATATTVVPTTATAPDRAAAPATPSCSAKALVIPASLRVKAIASGEKGSENCDPKNCTPANCVPRSCNTTATTLAIKQE